MNYSYYGGGANGSGDGRDLRMVEGVIANLPLFRQVAHPQIVSLAAHSRALQVRRGGTICGHGERMPGVFAIAHGSVMLALRRPDGGRRVVRFLGARESFGTAAALHDRPCPVDVIALADSLVVSVPVQPLLRLLAVDPCFVRNLMRELSENYLGMLEELEASVQQSAVQRLASYLDSLAVPNGTPHTWTARLPVSKTAIAERLGMTKETMSRLLRELSARGAIEVARRDITILDRDRLAAAGR